MIQNGWIATIAVQSTLFLCILLKNENKYAEKTVAEIVNFSLDVDVDVKL